jgi:hypothetical protein
MNSIKCSTAPASRRRVEDVIAGLQNPAHKHMLQIWLQHWWGEVVYDLDAIMETVSEDISYRWFGTEQLGGEIYEDSSEFARSMYRSMFDAKLMPGGPFDGERWAFADWGMTLEAVFTSAFPGAMLKGKSAQSDPDQLYLVQWPMMISFPFDRERWLMKGEIMYPGPPQKIEPTDRATISRLLGHG